MPTAYPTRLLILLAAAGAPVALLVGAAMPALWPIGLAWPLTLLALGLLDAALAPGLRVLRPRFEPPDYLAVGRAGEARLTLNVQGLKRGRVEAALEAEGPLGLTVPRASPAVRGDAEAVFVFGLSPPRRGLVRWEAVHLRWRGPLGLAWRQARTPLAGETPVGSDIRRLEDEALRMFARDAHFGAKVQLDAGEGSEFQALRDFQTGMDRRAIDWKQSARHNALLAKEFRTERNHQVLLAIDCGRTMSEPVNAAPRVDHAIHAALLLAFVSLRAGDRAGLYGFDDRPRLNTGALPGVGAFTVLHREAARIDYGEQEPNYALGLTTLSAGLGRRSLIVVFTEFADSTAAELMIETVGRLVRKHLVLFAVMEDEELETLAEAEPLTSEDVTRAVVAASLLRERDLVLARLRRLGAHVVQARAEALGPAALNAYLDLKRRDLL